MFDSQNIYEGENLHGRVLMQVPERITGDLKEGGVINNEEDPSRPRPQQVSEAERAEIHRERQQQKERRKKVQCFRAGTTTNRARGIATSKGP